MAVGEGTWMASSVGIILIMLSGIVPPAIASLVIHAPGATRLRALSRWLKSAIWFGAVLASVAPLNVTGP